MSALYWLIILAYFGLIFGIAWWAVRKGKDTTDDYFLAGRHLGWFVVGAGRNGMEYSVLLIACLLANAWRWWPDFTQRRKR